MNPSPFLGFPSITLPAGLRDSGIPMGVTFLGRPFSEPTLIELAYAFEQATSHRMPPATAPPLAGESLTVDFNDDGTLDGTDVDALVAEIAAMTNATMFDLTGDGLVDDADLTRWLVVAGAVNLPSGNPYLYGDANLDGVVDGSDFIRWNENKFTLIAAWTAADFNADGTVDGLDFIVWNENRFMSSDDVSSVPEPSLGVCLIAAALASLAIGPRR